MSILQKVIQKVILAQKVIQKVIWRQKVIQKVRSAGHQWRPSCSS